MKEEIWKDIPGYEGLYQVSTMGRMRRISQEQWRVTLRSPQYRYLKGTTTSVCKQGRYVLMWLAGGRRKLLHRLIAETFIPNPDNKPQINHIDGNPRNNRVDNLEWVTASENQIHSYHVLEYNQTIETRIKRAKRLYKKVIDYTDNKVYESIKEYAQKKSLNYRSVVCKLNGYTTNDLNIDYYQNAEAREELSEIL